MMWRSLLLGSLTMQTVMLGLWIIPSVIYGRMPMLVLVSSIRSSRRPPWTTSTRNMRDPTPELSSSTSTSSSSTSTSTVMMTPSTRSLPAPPSHRSRLFDEMSELASTPCSSKSA